MIQPMAIGNALQVFLTPPPGAEYWRVIRKGTDDISDINDQYAIAVYEGDERCFMDTESLTNELMAFYKPYYRINGQWVEGKGNHGTPRATYEDYSTEVLSLLRDRLEAGLKVEVERGNILNDFGYVQVMTAPPNVKMPLAFPLVTVTLEDESPAVRALGEDIIDELYDPEDEAWADSDGWLANVRLNIVGWSLNPDERIELRKAIRRVIVGNLKVFASNGVILPNLSLTDTDAVNGEFGETPMYLVTGDFTCTAPVRVGHMASGIIKDINVEVTNG